MDPILSVWCPLCSLNPPGFGCDRSQMPCPQGASCHSSCHSWRWSIHLLQGLLCEQLRFFSTSLYLPSLAPPVLYLPSSLPTLHIILRCACVNIFFFIIVIVVWRKKNFSGGGILQKCDLCSPQIICGCFLHLSWGISCSGGCTGQWVDTG